MKFSALLDVDVVAVEAEDEVSVLLELTAPAAQAGADRAVSSLQVVLDASGSMHGPRLEGAKAALLSLVDRLDSRDNFGVVTFDDATEVVVPAGPLQDKEQVRAAIARVRSGGTTDLSGGYLRGLQEARRVAGETGATLLLISDGHANSGVTDSEQLGDIARRGHRHGVLTSTLGYGLGYDETVLSAISTGGSGNHHFAEEPDTAGKLIASEVDGLLSKVVQAASLTIAMHEPVRSVSLYNDLPTTALPDGRVMVELGDFYADESRKLLLKVTVPALPELGLAEVAELGLQYVELPALVEHRIDIPVAVNVVPGDAAAGRVPDIKVRSEVAFQQAQARKKDGAEALQRGDSSAGRRLFEEARDLVGSALSSAPPDLAAGLEAETRVLDSLAERTRWDDHSRLAKDSHSSYHRGNRKRGRRDG